MAQAQYDEIRRHGEETYPHECCGVLLGNFEEDATAVTDTVRVENIRTDSAHNRYRIAPQELIRVQREGRKKGLDIVGFYHSHPDHPAQWSQTDLAEAHWFGCSYIITRVVGLGPDSEPRCRAMDTNSFLLAGTVEEDKRLEPQPLEVTAAVGA
jgi:proteasome lid subunit RPN8/RPN11